MSQRAPNPAAVAAGQPITWTNGTDSVHHLTADDGSFETGDLAAGATNAAVLAPAGTVPYHCTIHPTMTGTITVAAEARRLAEALRQAHT